MGASLSVAKEIASHAVSWLGIFWGSYLCSVLVARTQGWDRRDGELEDADSAVEGGALEPPSARTSVFLAWSDLCWRVARPLWAGNFGAASLALYGGVLAHASLWGFWQVLGNLTMRFWNRGPRGENNNRGESSDRDEADDNKVEASEVEALHDRRKRARVRGPMGTYARRAGESTWEMALGRERTGAAGLRRLADVPSPLVKAVDPKFQHIPSLVLRIEQATQVLMASFCTRGPTCPGRHGVKPGRQAFKTALQYAGVEIREALRVVCAPLEAAGTTDPQVLKPEQACQFASCGGGKVLADFLMCTIPKTLGGFGKEADWLLQETTHSESEEDNLLFLAWYHTLDLLREVCLCSQGFNQELALDIKFVVLLFNLLRVPKLFDPTLILCEEIVCAPTPEIFDLSELTNLDKILYGLCADELTLVCRVLVLLVHEGEDPSMMGEPPVAMALLRSRAKALNQNSRVHRNQQVLASMPGLMQRLIHVLRLQAPVFPGEPNDMDEDLMTAEEVEEALLNPETFREIIEVFRMHGMSPGDVFSATRDYMLQRALRGRQIVSIVRSLLDRFNVNKALDIDEWKDMPAPLKMDEITALVEASLSGPRDEPEGERLSARSNADGLESVEERLCTLDDLVSNPGHNNTDAYGQALPTWELEEHAQSTPLVGARIKRLLRSIYYLGDDDEDDFDAEVEVEDAEDVLAGGMPGTGGGTGLAGGMPGTGGGGGHTHEPFPTENANEDTAPGDAQANADADAFEEDQRAMIERARLEAVSKQVEVLFLLAMLAGSLRKASVNHDLARFNLVAMVSRLFHKLPWDASDEESAHQRLHGANCQCNPMATIKIQFLRLVHNFCDRESAGRTNKRLLLSVHDLRVCQFLYRYDGQMSVKLARELNADCGDNYDPEDPQHVGLLYKLTQVMKKEDPNSQHRSWIASTLEAYMRGATLEEQLLFSAWDVTSHVVDQMLETGFKGPGMLQTNFDLLGELIKFNKIQFSHLEDHLGHDRILALMRLAVTHLIDSNVFLRTVILSLDYFALSDPDTVELLVMGRFLRKHRITILQSLMTVVKLETASQENMCCLNTALLILMLAHRRGQLTHYLQAVEELEPSYRENLMLSWSDSPGDRSDGDTSKQEADDSKSDSETDGKSDSKSDSRTPDAAYPGQGSPALVNFRRLLWFWRLYYVQTGGVDGSSLASTSSIPFQEWSDIVDILCKDDGSATSLLREGQKIDVPSFLDLLPLY